MTRVNFTICNEMGILNPKAMIKPVDICTFSAHSAPRSQRHFRRGKLKGSSESWIVPTQGS